jgi:soluble lytic murein transglycosylase
MPIVFLLLILLPTFLFPRVVSGGEIVFVYVDPTGTIHFSDTPKHKGYLPYRKGSVLYAGSESPQGLRKLVEDHARTFGFDPLLIHALVEVESGYNPYAISPRGALGLMQLIPETAERFGVEDPFDPIQNILGGLRYLRYLWITFSGDLPRVLAAYHAGEKRVKEHRGIPPIASTREYVRRILKLYNQRKTSETR